MSEQFVKSKIFREELPLKKRAFIVWDFEGDGDNSPFYFEDRDIFQGIPAFKY